MLYDMHSATIHEKKKVGPLDEPESLAYKQFEDYDLNYKLFSEAKFILWKLLAIIKYSQTNLADFPVSKTQASIMSSNLRDINENTNTSPEPRNTQGGS